MISRAGGVMDARLFHQTERGGSIPTSALQLWIHRCTAETAVELNREWHSTLPRIGDPIGPLSAGLHLVASFDRERYAVAIWTHPVSRVLPQKEWLELRRFAIAPDAPRNTASRMLAVMVRLIRKQRPGLTRLISYQDTEAHTGGIYRACGWQPFIVPRSNTNWGGQSRSRPASQSTAKKVRWELELTP